MVQLIFLIVLVGCFNHRCFKSILQKIVLLHQVFLAQVIYLGFILEGTPLTNTLHL